VSAEFERSDEIDLRDLIVGLYNGRWWLIACVVLCLLLAVIYIKVMPQTYKANMSFKPIESFTAAQYAPLNGTEFVSIGAGQLNAWFFEEPQSALVDAMLELNYVPMLEGESDSEYLLRVGQVAASFEFTPPSTDPKKVKTNWALAYQTKQPELSMEVLQLAFTAINKNIQQKLANRYAFNVQQFQTSIENSLDDINLKIASLEESYNTNLLRKIALIEEQAEIARSLDIANNQLVRNMEGGKDLVVLANQQMPTYLNGYIALEKEISLLKNRGKPQEYISEMASLMAEKYALENSKKVERADKLYQLTPLEGNDFTAVRYNMANLEIKPRLNSALLLALAIVLGGMLGIMIIIVRSALKK
jgi:LPS O-antigen subunit length determinant protein (WzzB/FepE family)